MLSSINTCLIIVYVTCLNSSVVEHLLSVQEVLGSILGLVWFLYTYFHLPPLQHLLAAVHAALIPCCRCRAAYHFFIIEQKTFMQCYTVALHKRLVSASVHAGLLSILKNV